MTRPLCLLVPLLALLTPITRGADPAPGIVTQEFLYDRASVPSCHASTVCETTTGLVASFFGGTREGAPDVGIWVCRHDDSHWSEPVEVARGTTDDGKPTPCWNPVLFQPPGGPLLLFYKVGPTPHAWWGMLMTSADGGKTWAMPTRLPEGILGPIKDKPILIDGTLICPSSTEDQGWRVHLESTKDLGKTWEATDPLGNDGTTIRGGDPTATLLLNGPKGLLMLCRSKQKKIAKAWSKDGGKTWTDLTLTNLPNPNSGIDAVQLSDGRSFLVYNDSERKRTPLNIAISSDGGETWKPGPVLESEPGEYSYPAIIQSADGLVHVMYTWHRQKIRHVVLDPENALVGVPLLARRGRVGCGAGGKPGFDSNSPRETRPPRRTLLSVNREPHPSGMAKPGTPPC